VSVPSAGDRELKGGCRGSYRDSFITCRKHRLDVNLIYDLDPVKFTVNLEEFVDQVPEVDYLNFFVTSLKWVFSL
jgi:elongator complex protein 1